MISKKHLVIKRSQLPAAGKGLFVTCDIKKGERIVEYKGRLQRWRDVKHLDGVNGYILRVNRIWAINAEPSKTAGRFANDAAGIKKIAGLTNNAEYVVDGNRCFIESKRAIKKGEEIFVAYGSEYWKMMRRLWKGISVSVEARSSVSRSHTTHSH